MQPSPELLRRIDAIDGCTGRWVIYNVPVEGEYSFAYRSLGESFPTAAGPYENCATPEEAARVCANQLWRGPLLAWQSDYLDADCIWPGGYDRSAIYRSNNRVFKEIYAKALENAELYGPGLLLDIRYVTDDMLEALQSLESYPLLDEDDHAQLEIELQEEAWQSWAARDWRNAVEKILQGYAPDDADYYWADEILDTVLDVDRKLEELFYACAEQTNTYWQEESDGCQWIDTDRVAEGIDCADLRDLTGLPLLPPDQEWRREPYPWPDGSTDPLAPPLGRADG